MQRRFAVKAITLFAIGHHRIFRSLANWKIKAANINVPNPNHVIWFKYPGKFWNSQGLHIGNGGIGISFLGGVKKEEFAITDKSLWKGGPGQDKNYYYGIKKGGKKHLKKIQDLIVTAEIGNLKKADSLVNEHFLGDTDAFGSFSAYGRFIIEFGHSGNVTEYRRSLDLSRAIANVSYESNGIKYLREYFCSYPDKAGVFRFTSSKTNSISLLLKWTLFHKDATIQFHNNIYEISGTVNGNGHRFNLKMHIRNDGGTVKMDNNKHLSIENANGLDIILASATEYDSKSSTYNGGDPNAATTRIISDTKTKSYKELKDSHITNYKSLYDRVNFQLEGNNEAEMMSTDERWKAYKLNKLNDAGLKVLYFNLSRYLLISSSREGFLPANLQGTWNMWETAQWSGNYQSNINVQMNYDSANAMNLNECMVPYIDWIKNLVKPGTAVAKEYYDSEGWVSHPIGNIWGYAAPGSELIWGTYSMGAAWHCHYIWKYYLYSQNITYLRDTAYPLMKGATEFWLQNLVQYKGKLIVAPSVSAEHGAFIRDGKLVASGSSFGQDVGNIPCPYQDIQILNQLFENTAEAARILNLDTDFVKQINKTKAQLMPMKIGRYGQLQEWEMDIDDPACNHRTIPHLYAVWPAKQITAEDGIYKDAAIKVLDMRGQSRQYKDLPNTDIYTASNWALGFRMICRTRLHQAEKANELFNAIINEAGFENLHTYQHIPVEGSNQPVEGNKYSDVYYFKTPEGLWYPVWEIDTSLALAGFMSEMLLQTKRDGTILLLPALPKEWSKGSISGLKAEGNITVNMKWEDGKITHFKFSSAVSKTLNVNINGVTKKVSV